MTSTARPGPVARDDPRNVIVSGIKLGAISTLLIVAFALASRALSGAPMVIVQIAILWAGGALYSFLPAVLVRPRDADSMGWAVMVAVIASVVFTILDTAILRPLKLYSWTWDAIGGGSGFWYIPIWLMISAFIAWMGCLIYAHRTDRNPEAGVVAGAIQTVAIAAVVFALLTALKLAPFHAAVAGLSLGLALVARAGVAALQKR